MTQEPRNLPGGAEGPTSRPRPTALRGGGGWHADLVPRAPSDRSRYRPIADPEFSSYHGREILQSWALVEKKMARSLSPPPHRPSSRTGKSCATGSHTAAWHRPLALYAS